MDIPESLFDAIWAIHAGSAALSFVCYLSNETFVFAGEKKRESECTSLLDSRASDPDSVSAIRPAEIIVRLHCRGQGYLHVLR